MDDRCRHYILKTIKILNFNLLDQGCPTGGPGAVGGPREVVGEKFFQKNFFSKFFYKLILRSFNEKIRFLEKIFSQKF